MGYELIRDFSHFILKIKEKLRELDIKSAGMLEKYSLVILTTFILTLMISSPVGYEEQKWSKIYFDNVKFYISFLSNTISSVCPWVNDLYLDLTIINFSFIRIFRFFTNIIQFWLLFMLSKQIKQKIKKKHEE